MSAERTSRAAIAAEQLCAALWEALHDQLRHGSPEQAAMLGERIAEISRSVSALARIEPDGAGRGGGAAGTSSAVEASAVEAADPAQEQAAPAAPAAAAGAGGIAASSPGSGEDDGGERILAAAIVDEQDETPAPIAIHDARRGVDALPWSAAVQRRLDRYQEDREPFAVMLLELLDAERLRLAQSPADAERQVRDVEAAMVAQLRPADALVREADGRYWLVAPQTGAVAAQRVAARVAAAARRAASHRGAPLEVAVGIAVCPEHGLEVISLLGHAEVDLYAAEAGGRLPGDPDKDSAA